MQVRLTAHELMRLAQAARHMAGDSKVPLQERAEALSAGYRIEATLQRTEVAVDMSEV